jgi:hypothetical protein
MIGRVILLSSRMTLADFEMQSAIVPEVLFIRADGAMAAREGMVIRFAHVNAGKLALAIVCHAGSIVSQDELVEFIWGDDDDGGPDRAHHYVYRDLMNVRDVLGSLGWRVARWYGVGVVAMPIETCAKGEPVAELEAV